MVSGVRGRNERLKEQEAHGRPSVGLTRRGAAAAELAILLPFLALVFGVVLDYCRIFYAAQTIQNCAYSGALYASETADYRADLSSPEAAALDAARAEAVSLNPPLKAENVTTTFDNANALATVSITYDFPLLTPFLGKSKTITITRTVTMAFVSQGP